ncbi:MAG: hypothetical protein ACI9MR_000966 [Myxococcota bacterium]|jgi:hypothetical protein
MTSSLIFVAAFATSVGMSTGDCGPSAPATGGDSTCSTCWRSTLYPESWTPEQTDSEGRFLHDFSYAGYHNGEVALPSTPPGATYAVTTYGADPTGTQDSTAAIQATINAAGAAGGGIVSLPAGTYLCHGLLTINASGVVLRGAGTSATKLVFTRSDAMTDKEHIRFAGGAGKGAQLALAVDGVSRSHTVRLNDASSLSIGDDVQVGWTITPAFVQRHDMEDTWVTFNGQWKPFFQRSVVAIDLTATPHTVELDVPLRYPAFVSDGASLRTISGYISEVGIEHLAVSNAVDKSDAYDQDRAHVIGMRNVKDGWVRDVVSFDSPWSDDNGGHHLQSGGIYVGTSKRVTVADCVMEEAQNRGPGGNGYLFEITRSSEILIRDSIGRKGRHNFIQNWDFGTNGCVFLRTESYKGRAYKGTWDPIGIQSCSEFHHSLSMANLIDASRADDCWAAENRNNYSSGAGLTATETVFWRTRGNGKIRSYNAGLGYVIGTIDIDVKTNLNIIDPVSNKAKHSAPEDFTEGLDAGGNLRPLSLYDDQLQKRMGN